MKPAFILFATFLALISPTDRLQAAFTHNFDPLVGLLVAREFDFGLSFQKRAACTKAIVNINNSTTLAGDVKAGTKVAKTLAAAFPGQFATVDPGHELQEALMAAFVGLGVDIQSDLNSLQDDIDALPAGPSRTQAQIAHDNAETALGLAVVVATGDFASAARFLKSAIKSASKGRKIVDKATSN